MQNRPSPASGKIITILATLILAVGCMVKEKPAASLRTDTETPPWDSAHFVPRSIPARTGTESDSLFSLFLEIARIDSLAGDQAGWKAEAPANDSLPIGQMFDTNFTFPQVPTTSQAYAYDDSFRDDTLYLNAYGNGLFTQDHPCASTYVLSNPFMHPAKWLRSGLTEAEIEAAIGKPKYHQAGVLRYLAKHAGPRPTTHPDDSLSTAADYNTFDVFEGVDLYFHENGLFAAVLRQSQPCH